MSSEDAFKKEMWIDIHAHLYHLSDPEISEYMNEAHKAGVELVLNSAVSTESSEIVIKQCTTDPAMRAAVGISPFDVNNDLPEKLRKLRSYCNDPNVIAVGETGLDTTNPAYPPLGLQLPSFQKQLDLAIELDLPVIVHSRGIESHVADLCRNRGARKVLFHCFTGDKASLKKLLSFGYYVSVSGIVTYKNSEISKLIHYIPLDRLFIESDTPYLAPVPHRGKKNKPAFLPCTGLKICDLLNLEPRKLREAIKQNYKTLFNNKG